MKPARLKPHPAAEVFPMMSAAELQELAEDIRQHGLREPVVLHEGRILDGRNRHAACRLVGAEVTTREHDGRVSPLDYVVAANLRRRHLTEAQRAAVAAELVPLFEIEARERQEEGRKKGATLAGRPKKILRVDPALKISEPRKQDESARSVAQAAKAVGAGVGATKALTAMRKAAPEVHALVKAGTMKVAQAKRLASVPPEERAQAVEEIRGGARPSEVLKAAPKVVDPEEEGLDEMKLGARLRREYERWPPDRRPRFIFMLRQVAGEMEAVARNRANQKKTEGAGPT